MQGQIMPFRVKIPPRPEARTYHSRRPHRKSRAGCAKCKQRRVKCDETRPHCRKCQKLGIDCTYEAILPVGCGNLNGVTHFIKHAPCLTAPDASAYSMSLRAVSTSIDDILRVKPGRVVGDGFSNLDTLRHFQDVVTSTVISKFGREVMRGKVIRLAFESPYLMHTIIATAMAHLRHSVPERSHSSYTLVEGQHLQLAIRQYSQEIETPMGPENMDALFSACLLMTVNSFPLEKYNPRQSFVFAENPAPSLNWLFVQSGLSHLLCRAQPWLPRSMWLETFLSSSRENRDFYQDKRPGRDRLPSALADICGITEHTTEETNPYLWPLRMLTPLLSVEPSLATFSQFTTFMGRLLPEFHDRLIQKDPPALILLAWWLALMYSIDLWWVKTRARSECAAICMYLENSRDPLVLKLLEFPAQRCGILLPSACSA